IESQGLDSVSMVPNDSLVDIDPIKEKCPGEGKPPMSNNSSLESSKVSLQSNSSTSGFSESKSDVASGQIESQMDASSFQAKPQNGKPENLNDSPDSIENEHEAVIRDHAPKANETTKSPKCVQIQ